RTRRWALAFVGDRTFERAAFDAARIAAREPLTAVARLGIADLAFAAFFAGAVRILVTADPCAEVLPFAAIAARDHRIARRRLSTFVVSARTGIPDASGLFAEVCVGFARARGFLHATFSRFENVVGTAIAAGNRGAAQRTNAADVVTAGFVIPGAAARFAQACFDRGIRARVVGEAALHPIEGLTGAAVAAGGGILAIGRDATRGVTTACFLPDSAGHLAQRSFVQAARGRARLVGARRGRVTTVAAVAR